MPPNALVVLVFAIAWSGTTAFTWSSASGPATWRNQHTYPCQSSDHHPFSCSGRRCEASSRRRQLQRPSPVAPGGSADSLKRHASGCPPLSSSSSSSSCSSSVEEFLLEDTGSTPPSRSENDVAVAGDAATLLAAASAAAAAEGGQHAFLAEEREGGDNVGGRCEDRSTDPSAGLMISTRQLSVGVVAGLAAVAFDYEHGMVGFHWFAHWAGGAVPHFPPRAAGDGGLGQVHFTPLKSAATGLGAGFTRAASRTLTFPLDTVKTRSQLSRLGAEDRARLPVEMHRLLDGPASFEGVFKGFSAFLAQAGPANAVFFLFYDALNALGAAALLGGTSSAGGAGPSSSVLPAALHLGASSIATVPTTLVRTPAELVKQRLQVGQESGNALEALLSIVRAEGVKGTLVGGKEQLMREIPFNAIQFTVYECLKSYLGSSELWADAALGAASSAVAALATQPVDTVKTRVMTKSVPGSFGGVSPGFLKSASLVAEAEGVSSLYLGLLPRLVLVSTGGAFYFWGQEFASQLMSRAGF